MKKTFLEQLDRPAFILSPAPAPRPVNRKLLASARARLPEKVAAVRREVAVFYHLTADDLLGRSRGNGTAAWARQVAMSMVIDLTAISDHECASLFSRDRATAWYSRRAVRDITDSYPQIAAELKQLRARLEALPEFAPR